jgi:hypothetical protein
MKSPQATIYKNISSNRSTPRRIFTTHEFLVLATVLHAHIGLPALVKDLEREMLDIGLDLGFIEFAADETLRIEDTGYG